MVRDSDLFLAVNAGDEKELYRLLKAGGHANASSKPPSGPSITLLSEALQNPKRLKCADLLLWKGANPNDFIHGGPAVCWLAKTNNVDALRLLLDYLPDVSVGNMERDEADGIYRPVANHAWRLAEEKGYTEIVAMLDRHVGYPKLEDYPHPIHKAQLFEPNAQGDCLLDSPFFWKQFPKVLEALAENNESLSLDELRQTSRDGRPWLQRAIECNQISPLLLHLNEQGEGLQVAELLDAEGKPSEALQKILDKQQINRIFTAEMCPVSRRRSVRTSNPHLR